MAAGDLAASALSRVRPRTWGVDDLRHFDDGEGNHSSFLGAVQQVEVEVEIEIEIEIDTPVRPQIQKPSPASFEIEEKRYQGLENPNFRKGKMI